MRADDIPLIVAASAATIVWLVAVGAIRALRQPREPPELEPSLELGPEPPALAGFLAGNFRVARDAVPATLLDLCARKLAEINRVDVDKYECRIEGASPEGLTPYERRVLEHLRERARDGVVPTQALTTGPGDESSWWWRAFVREVVDDAQRRGLSRDLWSRRLAMLFGLAAAVPTVLVGLAFGLEKAALYTILPLAVIGRVRYGRRQRDTPAGLEAAARWRAVQAKLAENPVFAEQPPIAVALWDRLLGYGAALGVAPGAIRPVPMGAEPEGRAWSTYGGRWHEVQVRYRHGPSWGSHPGWALLQALLVAALGTFVLWLAGSVVLGAIDDVRGLGLLILTSVLGVPAVLAIGGCLLALRAALDLRSSDEVTGEIVRLRVAGSGKSGEAHYVAVDDGSSTTVRAWSVRPQIYAGLEQGQIVTAVVTPRLRYVRSIKQTAAAASPE